MLLAGTRRRRRHRSRRMLFSPLGTIKARVWNGLPGDNVVLKQRWEHEEYWFFREKTLLAAWSGDSR